MLIPFNDIVQRCWALGGQPDEFAHRHDGHDGAEDWKARRGNNVAHRGIVLAVLGEVDIGVGKAGPSSAKPPIW